MNKELESFESLRSKTPLGPGATDPDDAKIGSPSSRPDLRKGNTTHRQKQQKGAKAWRVHAGAGSKLPRQPQLPSCNSGPVLLDHQARAPISRHIHPSCARTARARRPLSPRTLTHAHDSRKQKKSRCRFAARLRGLFLRYRSRHPFRRHGVLSAPTGAGGGAGETKVVAPKARSTKARQPAFDSACFGRQERQEGWLGDVDVGWWSGSPQMGLPLNLCEN